MSRCLAFLFALLTLPLFANDLTVSLISREPEIPFVWASANPRVEGWPAVGSTVTWRAHVRSFFADAKEVAYIWRVDDYEVARGTITLAPNAITTIDLPRTWTFERQRLSLAIDTTNAIAEQSELNNQLEVITDAIAVGFWVEQSVYDHFRKWQPNLRIGSTSFEDWAQRNIDFFNDMAALAIYPETPNGVFDRWRLQKLVIVPDGALPLHGLPEDASPGANGGTHPDKDDRTVDLMWGFRASTLNLYQDVTTVDPSNPFYVSGALFHELGHARYLIDVYAWNVRHQPPNFVIGITENGAPIVGNYIGSGYAWRTLEQGMMNVHLTYIDRYSAIAMNFIAGARATFGNYNEPRNFASFLNDLPAQNRLTIRDENGTLMTNASVKIYQSRANGQEWYATNYDDVADLELTTDANGQVLVGRSPFAADGKVIQAYGNTNGTAIVRVAKENYVGYGFLESRLFNLEYWRGHTDFADHELRVGLYACPAATPILTSPKWDATTNGPVTLTWNGVTGALEYRIYTSTNLGAPQLVATTETSMSAQVQMKGRTYWWLEAITENCGTRRSDVGRINALAMKRRAVTMWSGGACPTERGRWGKPHRSTVVESCKLREQDHVAACIFDDRLVRAVRRRATRDQHVRVFRQLRDDVIEVLHFDEQRRAALGRATFERRRFIGAHALDGLIHHFERILFERDEAECFAVGNFDFLGEAEGFPEREDGLDGGDDEDRCDLHARQDRAAAAFTDWKNGTRSASRPRARESRR